MNKYIFTFGSNQLYAGFYQPIYANNSLEAREKMVELHGLKWSFQYTEEEWNKTKDELSGFQLEQPLEPVFCKEE